MGTPATTAPQPPPPPPLSLRSVLADSFLIVSSHSRHFLALSLLFLLPPSFILSFFLFFPAPSHTQSLLRSPPRHRFHPSPTALATLAYSSFLLFSLLATCSINCSLLHAFYGRPVKILYSIQSIVSCFLPMLATFLSILSITFSFFVPPAIFLFYFKLGSAYAVGLFAATSIAALAMVTYLLVQWSLASVIVVAESYWGFHALRRSNYLIKGMRIVALKAHVFFGALLGVLLWLGSLSAVTVEGLGIVVLEVVVVSSGVMAVAVMSLAASVVAYMYSRAVNGELAAEITEEFVREYVSLPFDEGKVPYLVSLSAAYLPRPF